MHGCKTSSGDAMHNTGYPNHAWPQLPQLQQQQLPPSSPLGPAPGRPQLPQLQLPPSSPLGPAPGWPQLPQLQLPPSSRLGPCPRTASRGGRGRCVGETASVDTVKEWEPAAPPTQGGFRFPHRRNPLPYPAPSPLLLSSDTVKEWEHPAPSAPSPWAETAGGVITVSQLAAGGCLPRCGWRQ